MPAPAEDLTPYLAATPVVDALHPAVAAFARRHTSDDADPRARAVRLYYAVRDGIRYDPYSIELTPEGLAASRTLAAGRGWCVAKAVLLAAAARAVGIPARLGFADVRNHLSTARMRALMDTDVFHWHGYTAFHLEGAWVKATPAFNVELCERFRLAPLEFDGRADSLYHPFDLDGRRHMEYLRQRGEYADVPLEAIRETFQEAYRWDGDWNRADFQAEVQEETGRGGSR
jgi:transglutaminase-like putative cysteine protease